MHNNGGMHMGGYGFGGIHVLWWISIIVIAIGMAVVLSRSLRRK